MRPTGVSFWLYTREDNSQLRTDVSQSYISIDYYIYFCIFKLLVLEASGNKKKDPIHHDQVPFFWKKTDALTKKDFKTLFKFGNKNDTKKRKQIKGIFKEKKYKKNNKKRALFSLQCVG